MMFFRLLRTVDFVFPPKIAYAHCDVPCGIYDPKPAQMAASAVFKMVEKIVNPPERDEKSMDSVRNFHNAMTRYVIVKEQEAQKCKNELLILWADFFKPEHLGALPDLHDKFWKAIKLCSTNKQEVSLDLAAKLVAAVDEIAEMFNKAKSAKK